MSIDIFLKRSKCAPHLKCEDKCYDIKDLRRIARKVNDIKKKNKHKLINLKLTKDKLWEELHQYFKSKC